MIPIHLFLVSILSGLVRRGVTSRATIETSIKMPHSIHHRTTTLCLLMSLFCAVHTIKIAADGTGFIFPTEGLTLHYNDDVLVDYISNYSTPYLRVWCHVVDDNYDDKLGQQVDSFNNTATVKLNWNGADTPCWFNLMPNSTVHNGPGVIGGNSPS